MEKLLIGSGTLSPCDVYRAAIAPIDQIQVEIASDARAKMDRSQDLVNSIVDKGEPVYGINTGFGALSSKHIDKKDLSTLQYNLIRSHCTGVGRPFDRETTRAIMILRAHCLSFGHSGITPEIVDLIIKFINHDILPIIPEKGSVGASGDLAPLSHLALSLIGEGDVIFDGKEVPSSFAISEIKSSKASLGPKDGLALINGTTVIAALGCLGFARATNLAKTSDIVAMMTLEALRGTSKPFDPRISNLKPHKGQLNVCQNLNNILENSEILDSHHNCGKVQDPYSLRCIPQVHGATRQTVDHLEEVLTTEINSVTDNPLLFPDGEGDCISGGNFHGEAPALALDYLAMGMSELASISERRMEKMMNPTFSDLPAFLVNDSGLNSGLMIAHVTMAALASENKLLCHPASVDSIPTSTDKEDHVSMGVTAGRKVREIIENLTHCLAIELLAGTQGIEHHRPLKSSPPLEAVFSLIRKHVPKIEQDRTFYKDIEAIAKLVERKEILGAAESALSAKLN